MIENIHIQNFKSLKDVSFKPTNLNLLMGLNGMGKTSFIQSLLLLRQNKDSGLSRFKLNGDYTEIGKGKDALYQDSTEDKIIFQIRLKKDDIIKDLDCILEYLGDSDTLVNETKYSRNELEQFALFNQYFQYIEAERLGPRVDYPTSSIGVKEKRQLGTQGEFTANYLNEFGHESINSFFHHPNARSATLMHQTSAWMSEISPGIKLNTKEILETGKIILDYQFERDELLSNHYRPKNVGFGISYVLPVVVALLTATPEQLIIIENPESHIHPRGQAELGKLISLAAANGTQLFVETHSDHLINGIRVAVKERLIDKDKVHIAYFHMNTNQSEKYSIIEDIRVDENGGLSNYPDAFMDEWTNQLLKLM